MYLIYIDCIYGESNISFSAFNLGPISSGWNSDFTEENVGILTDVSVAGILASGLDESEKSFFPSFFLFLNGHDYPCKYLDGKRPQNLASSQLGYVQGRHDLYFSGLLG